VSDVVAANLAALAAPAATCSGKAYNIAGGREVSLLEILDELGTLLDVTPDPEFTDSRAGDVRHSCADVSAARADLGWEAQVPVADGLRRTVEWMRSR
jgi:UDP-glucose 4-epimerase